jgi:hypothetical protein
VKRNIEEKFVPEEEQGEKCNGLWKEHRYFKQNSQYCDH